MSIQEQEGVLDQVSEKGIILAGNRLSYSKWFEGDRPTEESLGCRMRVVVDVGTKCSFVKRVVKIGEKSASWKPPESLNKGSGGAGGGRRYSPEELELEIAKGVRIARSVALERAIIMVEKGITIEKIAGLASGLEAYLLKGEFPQAELSVLPEIPVKNGPERPPSPNPVKAVTSVMPESTRPSASAKEAATPVPAKPKRLAARVVSGLFNEAMRGGLVEDWPDFLAYSENVLKVQINNLYKLDVQDFATLEAVIRSKLGQAA